MYFSIWTVDIGWSFLFLFPKNTGNVVEVDVKKYFFNESGVLKTSTGHGLNNSGHHQTFHAQVCQKRFFTEWASAGGLETNSRAEGFIRFLRA